MNIDQTISELNALSVAERLHVISAVWDSLPDAPQSLTTPAQDKELDRRLQAHRNEPDSSISFDELTKRLGDSIK